jgi:tryptophanyl-tRNA synthetase
VQGSKGKMSASDPNSAVFMTDSKKEIQNKINKYAYSGGQATAELQRLHGANLEVDVPYQYLTFFLEDDAELQDIGQVQDQERKTKKKPHIDNAQKYSKGELMTGHVKKRLIELMQEMVQKHQEARSKVTEEVLDLFMSVRKLEF